MAAIFFSEYPLKYPLDAWPNSQIMRNANAEVGKPNMPRVSMQKNAKNHAKIQFENRRNSNMQWLEINLR